MCFEWIQERLVKNKMIQLNNLLFMNLANSQLFEHSWIQKPNAFLANKSGSIHLIYGMLRTVQVICFNQIYNEI